MAEFDLDKMAHRVAEKALDEFLYKGKTIREWVELMVTAESVVEVRMVEELEKIKDKAIDLVCDCCIYANECPKDIKCSQYTEFSKQINNHIAELKGENNDKLYCAKIECKYNKNKKCKANTVNLDAWYGNTNEGYQKFSRCRTYEDSEYTIKVKNFLAELKRRNNE